ncbi:MAG: zinc-binding dehydrogenase, partial [Ruminococcus sp.]|nr:zinc-binding dehydrogenase [Ruminococcus sp.]
PIVPGIECVGVIADVSDTNFTVGQKVIALMGGMGRSFNGSYAEYALLPAHHIFAIESELPWERLAAVPETYFTSYDSLFECLRLKKEDTLLIRGATCALGYAAIQIAKALGCKVIATTHKENKLPLIANADETVLDDGRIAGKVKAAKALELVGAKTIRDTLRCMTKGGIVCHTGILGGVYTLDGFDPIKEIPNGVYLTGFFSNYPTQQTVDEIFAFLNEHKLEPCFGECFDFEHIKDACIALDSGNVNGKIVVKMP